MSNTPTEDINFMGRNNDFNRPYDRPLPKSKLGKRMRAGGFLFALWLGANMVANNVAYVPDNDYVMSRPIETGRYSVIDDKLERKIEGMLSDKSFDYMNRKIDADSWAALLKGSFRSATGDEITQNENYMNVILTIIYQESGYRTSKRWFRTLPFVEKTANDTDGPFQVSVPLGNKIDDPIEMTKYSMKKLDEIVRIYCPDRNISDENVKYILADWNAGKNASRFAAVQSMLVNELGKKISIDGDFGKESIESLRELNSVYGIGLVDSDFDRISSNPHEIFSKDIYGRIVQMFPYAANPVMPDAMVRLYNFLPGVGGVLSYLRGDSKSSSEFAERGTYVFYKIGKK